MARIPNGRASASSTSNASPSSTSPAATTGITGTAHASEQRHERFVLDLPQPPPPTGLAPRCQIADHVAATSWPSHASRPKTFTMSGRPSGVAANASATPRGCSTASRRSVASTPSSASASDTCSSVRFLPASPPACGSAPPRRTRSGTRDGADRKRRPEGDADDPEAMIQRPRCRSGRDRWRRRHDHRRRHGDPCREVDRRR